MHPRNWKFVVGTCARDLFDALFSVTFLLCFAPDPIRNNSEP
jgi:hypothetical protein